MTNIFNRSYRFYEKGAPYPGICSTCSNTNRLWDLGIVKGTNQGLYLCDTCLSEVATFAGFVLLSQHQKAVEAAAGEIRLLQTKLDAAPALIRKLNEDVSNLLAGFVTDMAAIDSKPAPVQRKDPKASPDLVSPNYRNKPQAGERTKQSVNPSTESSRS